MGLTKVVHMIASSYRLPRRATAFAMLALLLAVLSGCSDNGLVKVKGKVLLDGKAVPNAEIVFVPRAGVTMGNGGFGNCDGYGAFQARQFTGRWGMFPGEYTVTLTARDFPKRWYEPSVSNDEKMAILQTTPELFPGKYTKPESSPLTATIARGMKPLSFSID